MTRVVKTALVGTLSLITLSFLAGGSIFGQAPANAQYADAVISEDSFAIIAQEIRDLKNPMFRALLRVRIVSWIDNESRQRQAALDVIAEGLSDLCANQDEIWRPTAGWLHSSLTRAAGRLEPSGAGAIIARCSLNKDESGSDAAREFASAMKLLNDPGTAPNAIQKARAAILTGQVPAASLMGDFLRLQTSNPASLPDLLSATLQTEQKHPGFIPLHLFPFLTPTFLAKSNPAELQAEFLLAVIRSTRLQPEDFANTIVRSKVMQALRVIAEPTKLLAPALYPELATRLNALGYKSGAVDAQRHAAEERIRASSDQLAQMESEAEKATDKIHRIDLLGRAAQKALALGKLQKAVDLALAARAEQGLQYAPYSDRLLGDVTRAAVNQKQPEAAVYAISKIEKALTKANGWLLLSKYYAEIREMEKGAVALSDSAKLLKLAEPGSDKLNLAMAVAQISLAYEGSRSYEAFQQLVETINRLPAPDKEKEKTFYGPLMPIAEDLIKGFRGLAAQDSAGALALAQQIKLPELRVSAMTGGYSRARGVVPQR